jgi:hypothetical protein
LRLCLYPRWRGYLCGQFGEWICSGNGKYHPMVTNANDSDQIAFWVIGSEAEARETEIKMIKVLKPRFNLGENGELKRSGYGQRTQPYSELKKVLRQVIREELKAGYLRP